MVPMLAALMTFAIMPQLVLKEAYAKYPYNGEHIFGQFMMYLAVPMGITIVVLGLWAMRARQPKITTKS